MRIRPWLWAVTLLLGCGPAAKPTVFLILMENHNWGQIYGNTQSAPFINGTLLAQGARAQHYFNPVDLHPSEPNYLWLEAGTNFAVTGDDGPLADHQSSTAHLVNQLEAAHLDWRSYQEGIDGTDCPLVPAGNYVPRHNPMVFFDDVTNHSDPASARCLAHVRPFSELSGELQKGTAKAYNFITPDLCNDMHNACTDDPIRQGDDWLSRVVPMITASSQYRGNGTIIVTWDEGELSDGPIGMIVLSPHAKAGFADIETTYDHSSTLKTIQEIFRLTPLLGAAADPATHDLASLFSSLPH